MNWRELKEEIERQAALQGLDVDEYDVGVESVELILYHRQIELFA